MFERGVKWLLAHDATVQSARPDGPVEAYAVGAVPQDSPLPAVTFEGIGQAGDTQHTGGDGGLIADSVLFTAWATDYKAAVELRLWVKRALLGKQGRFDGDDIEGIFTDSRRSETDPTPARSEHKLHGLSMILKIWHRE